MINSFSKDKKEKILFPGMLLYEDVYPMSKEDIENIKSVCNYINENEEFYSSKKIKNTFFYGLSEIGKRDLAENIQKGLMYYFAKYCEIYEETIHTVQWQEKIYIDIEFPGERPFIFNPNKSFMDEDNNIKNTPFSRQVVVEIFVDDDYSGGALEWIYLNGIDIDKFKKGSILFYPANYLFSKKHNTIIKGNRAVITTFLNGGKDFLSEESGFTENANLAFSYIR